MSPHWWELQVCPAGGNGAEPPASRSIHLVLETARSLQAPGGKNKRPKGFGACLVFSLMAWNQADGMRLKRGRGKLGVGWKE